MFSSSIDSILKSARELTDAIHVSGTTPSARAFLIAKYAYHSFKTGNPKIPTVVICSNHEIAGELCADLECLAPLIKEDLFGENNEESSLNILHFPTWDQSPYNPVNLSIQTRLARLLTLSEIALGPPPDLIITSIAASIQATLPVELFQALSIQIQVEESIGSRDSLTSRLIASGYQRVDPVEDMGTFAVRGDIVDVFPPNREKPIRIELFGDFLEQIREFDPVSQRVLNSQDSFLSKIIIPPARELILNETTSPLLRENLKKHADDMEIPRTLRDPILQGVKNGGYPDHSDSWAPFAYSKPACLWDYLGTFSSASNFKVIWDNELSCLQSWEKLSEEQREQSKRAAELGIIVPPVNTLFAWNTERERCIREKSKIFIDQVELATAETVKFEVPPSPQSTLATQQRVFVKGNGDLSKAPRHTLNDLEPLLKQWTQEGFKIIAFASTLSQLERIRFLLEERGFLCSLENRSALPGIALRMGSLSEGFQWPSEGVVLITEGEILGVRHAKKQRKFTHSESGSAAKSWSGIQTLSNLAPGDAIVHIDHGIGRYQGIVRLDLSGAPSDFLLLEYANKDKLYLPAYRLNVIQRYIGAGESISLDRLGGQQFSKAKEKVRDAVKRLAFDLVQLYARRKIQTGIQFSPRDSEFREFEASFPFDETPDQLKAIDSVLSDLESGRVMDRLVCGDVGYGKTEIAIRAAFRAVSDGYQVAVLVPTTVLAQQHEQTFKSRLSNYPLNIESISRFKSTKTQKTILDHVVKGKIDIVIGTHRLLSKDVHFHNLGLIIVDEEHRFGVEHKERLKALKIDTHVLTLTATPIPRTLHMSLSGLRDISLINTPPVDRLPIRTYLSKNDDALIQKAIQFEIGRGGQVFYLHNRVQSIKDIAHKIRTLVQEAEVVIAHGQMSEHELEQAMLAFYQKKANVLLCTTIIESGLDIPSANTILIDRADTLGLAQLYQIRGRVGRGQNRAYAYLFIPIEGTLTEDAKKRLEVIQRFVELGSGFGIASHDLEIRGGGDLLGPQQSGNIAAVGFDLYTELLEEAIRDIQGLPPISESSQREPEIKVPFPSYLAEEYVPDVHQRLSFYRRFSATSQESDIDLLEEELKDRFGSLPVEAQNLMWLIRIKVVLKKIGIDSLSVGPDKVSLLPGPQSKLDPVRAIALVSAHPHQYQLRPDSKLVAKIPTGTLRDLFFGLEVLFKDFS